MFTLYLVGLGIIAPWKETCAKPSNSNYTLVEQNDEEDELPPPPPPRLVHSPSNLSDSTFIPIKGTQTDTESGDDISIRSVKFNAYAEVRELSPHEANEALLSRLSYSASMRFKRQKTHHKTARTALMFCVLWFIANYLFQVALDPGETALVTMLSSTSSIFTLLLAAAFPSASGDAFTLSKFCAVILSCCGAVMVSLSEMGDEPKTSKAIVLALLSAFFYSAYLVLVKRKNDTEERIDLPLFFGFVGICNIFLMWPLFFVLNFSRIETFEWPNQRQFAILFLNGLVGTVLSEALWLWGCLLTSSVVGTLAMSLQLPLAMLFDLVLRNKSYPPLFYLGTIPMFFALVFVAFLTKNDDVDPLLRIVKIVYRKLWICRKTHVIRVPPDDLLHEQEHESLIDEHDS